MSNRFVRVKKDGVLIFSDSRGYMTKAEAEPWTGDEAGFVAELVPVFEIEDLRDRTEKFKRAYESTLEHLMDLSNQLEELRENRHEQRLWEAYLATRIESYDSPEGDLRTAEKIVGVFEERNVQEGDKPRSTRTHSVNVLTPEE